MAAVFGLSGSVKSTLSHATHGGKYHAIKVLHDDAFIINSDTCASIALEPTYFDKTSDYPVDAPDNKYLLTVQNCSATLDEDGKIVCVTEDIRKGNGRALKSKLWWTRPTACKLIEKAPEMGAFFIVHPGPLARRATYGVDRVSSGQCGPADSPCRSGTGPPAL